MAKRYTLQSLYDQKLQELSKKNIVFRDFKTDAKMESSLIIPSAVQAYSLGVEYVRDWIVGKFDPGYFKTVFINGRHIMQDYMKYSTISMVKRDKPAVAITPNPDLDYDRNNVDTYMGGTEMLIRKFNHQQSFFKDYDHNIFLGMGVREQQINFTIRFRVSTRAQQLDLYRNLEMRCRIGFTHVDYISADFHIPYELMVNIAKHANFEVDAKDNIVDTVAFVRYLNMHSEMPISYKLRAVNGRREFFVRARRVYVHLNTMDKLSYDDGDREGQLDNDFHVEMALQLNMWVPSYYVYTSAQPVYKVIPCMESEGVGLYTFKVLEIPETNENGWNRYFTTGYALDDDEVKAGKTEIDVKDLITSRNMWEVIDQNKSMAINPSRFIDIDLYDINGTANAYVDWETNKMIINNITGITTLKIVIYIDMEYYNDHVATIENINKSRLN